jgi:flavin reductase (DIM6/NTAB) family NADH-FMN oxidoreductase RutF
VALAALRAQRAADRDVGAPLLAGAIAWLECRIWSECAVGDDTLFVGEVLAAELGEDAPPLVHVGGEYRALS